MRLTTQEVEWIVKAIEKNVSSKNMALRLFGSRVKDDRKGGDIDLLLIVEDVENKNRILQKKSEILVSIKNGIGDQKVDLIVATVKDCERDAFLKIIFSESKEMYVWG